MDTFLKIIGTIIGIVTFIAILIASFYLANIFFVIFGVLFAGIIIYGVVSSIVDEASNNKDDELKQMVDNYFKRNRKYQ